MLTGSVTHTHTEKENKRTARDCWSLITIILAETRGHTKLTSNHQYCGWVETSRAAVFGYQYVRFVVFWKRLVVAGLKSRARWECAVMNVRHTGVHHVCYTTYIIENRVHTSYEIKPRGFTLPECQATGVVRLRTACNAPPVDHTPKHLVLMRRWAI